MQITEQQNENEIYTIVQLSINSEKCYIRKAYYCTEFS